MTMQQRHNPGRPASVHRRAYTIVELLIVVAIITLLAALVFVAVGASVRQARVVSEQRYLAGLGLAVEQFKRDFGFYPPLVSGNPFAGAEAEPAGPSAQSTLVLDTTLNNRTRPRVVGEDQSGYPTRPAAAEGFLRYEFDPGTPRYSAYSLGIYLFGGLGKNISGAEGAGFTRPDIAQNFAFQPGGRVFPPLVDMAGSQQRLRVPEKSTVDQRVRVLTDRWDQPLRYFRWEPIFRADGQVDVLAADTSGGRAWPGYNVPRFLGDPTAETRLRSARFAIVSSGPDLQINEADPEALVNRDNIVFIGGEP
jgi:prepilin-type N-terminal cleavage/methylation domain-containing protein